MNYLYRPAGPIGNDRWRERSQFHLIGDDGRTSVCKAAVLDIQGYRLEKRENPPLRSMTCNNCLTGRVVRKAPETP